MKLLSSQGPAALAAQCARAVWLVAFCVNCAAPHFPQDAGVDPRAMDAGDDVKREDAAGNGVPDTGENEVVREEPIEASKVDADAGRADADASRVDADASRVDVDAGKVDVDVEASVALPNHDCPPVPAVAPGPGHSAAVGDFDADNRMDLVLGYPADHEHSGSACIYYGRGFIAGAFTEACQRIDQDSPGVPAVAEGLGATGDRFGFSLATGDFDGNLVTDLAVGAPYESATEPSRLIDQETGVVNTLFGTATQGLNALNGQGIPLIRATDWTQDSDGMRSGSNEDFDRSGSALAALDVDGDGVSDLFVGAPGETPDPDQVPSAFGAGVVLQVPGPMVNTALTKSVAVHALDFADVDTWPVTAAQGARAADERLGAALAVVPIDLPGNSARSVLLVGSPGESDGVGAVFAWFIDPVLGFTNPTKKAVISAKTSRGSSFGHAIASDGQRVFIGAPGQSNGAGRVYVVDLAQIPSYPGTWPAFVEIAQPKSVAGGPEPGDAFGFSLALQHRADMDLLIVGAPGEHLNDKCNVGVVHRFRASDLSYYDSVEGSTNEFFGYAVGAGDFNNDGDSVAFATAPDGLPSGQLTLWH